MPKQEIEAIIDRSGSMAGKETDTIGGINSTIDQLKHDLEEEHNTEVNLSIKFFDHEEYYLMESLFYIFLIIENHDSSIYQ